MKFRDFSYKSASYRILDECYDQAVKAVKELRGELEGYIASNPPFLDSLVPVDPVDPVPEIALRMHNAARLTGLGPMAAVAGTIAQMACERCRGTGLERGAVENGGDLYLDMKEPVTLGIYAGERILKGKLAFRIPEEMMPLAICSSSGTMGHSLSLGRCDLATVFARDASLADAAATLAGNLVSREEDLEPAVNRVLAIEGIQGVLLVKGDKIGLGGRLPELVSVGERDITAKISRDKSPLSSFPGNPNRKPCP